MPKVNNHPYDSTDLRRLMGNTNDWATDWDDLIWYLKKVAVYDRSFKKNEIEPLVDDIRRVKEEANPFTTDYRQLYIYITGNDCPECPPAKRVKAHSINLRKLADEWLLDLEFPAGKDEAIKKAKEANAPKSVMEVLKRVKDQEYPSVGSLIEQIGELSWRDN